MNIGGTLKHLTATNADGSYKIPKIIYSDAYSSEMVAYADLVLPDTTYLERYDCISLLDRPISEPDGPADAIRHPVVQAGSGRARLSGRADRSRRAAESCRASRMPTVRPSIPAGTRTTSSTTSARPVSGRSPAGAVRQAKASAPASPTRSSSNATSPTDRFIFHRLPREAQYLKHANKAYLEFAKSVGFVGNAEPIIFQLYSEVLQKFRLAARGHGVVQPPALHKQRIERYFDPLPFWYAPFEGTLIDQGAFPMHAITQRPMAMYHSWGSQNAWLRQIHGANHLYMARSRGVELGITDDDWVWITSAIGRVKAQVRLMEGVNPDTVWTWNAIGKRSGAWALAEDAPESSNAVFFSTTSSTSCCRRAMADIATPTPIPLPVRRPGMICASGSSERRTTRLTKPGRASSHSQSPTKTTVPSLLDFGRAFNKERKPGRSV